MTYVHTVTMPCMGMVLALAYFIGVGFLVAYLLARQCEGLQAGKQPSGSSRLFLCLYMNVLEHTLRDELMKNEEDLETANLVHGSYRELLFDVRWKQKRARILERDGYKCIVCGATEDLTVHHKQYHVDQQGRKHVPWDYEDKYLVTLCSVCHRNGHSKFNVPVFEV